MRRFVLESAGLSACLVLLVLQAGCGLSPQSYVDKGAAFAAAGNYIEASINYRKAIQKDYRFAEAYHKLGMSEFFQGRTDEAVDALKQASFFNPSNRTIQEDLADVAFNRYLTSGKTPSAYEAVNKLVTELNAAYPDSATALRLRASLQLGDGKLTEAINLFEAADKRSPLDPAVLLPLADALKMDNRLDEADVVARRLMDSKPTFSPVYDWLVQTYLASGKMDEAEVIIKRRIEKNPKDSEAILMLGRYYRAQHRTQDADDLMQSLLKRSKDFPDRYTLVGDFYAGGRNWEQAEQVYRAGIAAEPSGKSAYLTRLASMSLAQKRVPEALKILSDAIEAKSDDWDAQAMRINVLLGSREPRQIDEALATAKTLVKKRDHDPRFPFLLATAYLAKGDGAAAVAAYQEAARLGARVLAPRLALAQISKERRDAAGMLRYSGAVLAVNPREPHARLIHADGLMAEGNFAEADIEMKSLLADAPNWIEARLDSALLFLAERRTKPAIAAFRALLSTNPGDQRALAGLVSAYLQEGSVDAALQVVNEQLKTDPESVTKRAMLAAVAMKAGKTGMALQEYEALAQAHPDNAEFRFQTGQLYEYMGDTKKAIANYEAAAATAGAPKGTVFDRLGTAYYATGMTEQADSAFIRAVSLAPAEPTFLNDRAYFLAETGRNPDEAIRLSLKALQLVPNNAALLDTLGLAYLAKGSVSQAADILTPLVRKFPDIAMFRFHLAMVLIKGGGREAAKKELETSLTKHPARDDEVKIRQLLATVS